MKQALLTINHLEEKGLIQRYAIGGAMALLFHDEPVVTYDLDIFCFLPDSGLLVSLEPLYTELKNCGYHSEAECVIIGTVPVQFIPAYNPLVIEAVEQAIDQSFAEVRTRVVSLEHLIAIMVQTNRPKDRQRVAMLAEKGGYDHTKLDDIMKRYQLTHLWKRLLS